MTPALGYLVITQQPVSAIFLLAVCGATDLVDGWIARKFKQQSALGSVLDPLGDKLLVGTLTISLFATGQIPLWLLLIILGRDIGLVAGSILTRWQSLQAKASLSRFFDPAFATVVVIPSTISKLNTALQLLLLGLTLCDPLVEISLIHTSLPLLQLAVAGTTIGSAISYIRNYRSAARYINKI